MNDFKITLEAARVNKGYTQSSIAERLEISRSTVCNWESGRVSPRISDLIALSVLYEVPVENFLLKTFA